MVSKIQCPNCGEYLDVEEVLAGKIQEHYQKEFEQKIQQQQSKLKEKEESNAKEFQLQQEKLAIERKEFEDKRKHQNILFKEQLEKEKAKMKQEFREESHKEVALKLQALEEENAQRKAENIHLKEQEINLLKKAKEIEEQAEELRRKSQKELLEQQKDIEEKAKAKERESFELEKQQLLKQIEDNKKLAEEMKRKAEQGSMQLQGEVQELFIEDLLAREFPYDLISEVPKGITGADCIQEVRNPFQKNCGKIVYESKRTKNFSPDWIAKLKKDQLNCNADLAVLVTQTMPSDLQGFGEKEGVWVCSFAEVRNLATVLRQMLIKVYASKTLEENKLEIKEHLFQYFSGNEFVQTVKIILDSQRKQKEELDQEKRAFTRIWKKREKQIEVLETNVINMFASIQGITGKEIGENQMLQFPEQEEE